MVEQITLYYTYLDECKKNFFTSEFYKLNNNFEDYNFYSLSSISFESEYYISKFEATWENFKNKFNIPAKTCLHFAEYKKLFSTEHVLEIKTLLELQKMIFGIDNTDFDKELLQSKIESFKNFKEIKEAIKQLDALKKENLLISKDQLQEKIGKYEKYLSKKKLEDYWKNNALDFEKLKKDITFNEYNKVENLSRDLDKIEFDKVVEGKKLFYRYCKLKNVDEKDIDGYNLFKDENNCFDIKKLHAFFTELKEVLQEAHFYILNTDFINLQKRYIPKKKQSAQPTLTKKTTLPVKNLAKQEPQIAFKKHLDILINYLLSEKSELNEGKYTLNENKPDFVYTKLRFDADGKEFEARNDLKLAFYESLSVGTDRYTQKTATKLLDEIRFIRKEEVGSGNTPPHCGLEVVDFLCSLVCSKTRINYLVKTGVISESDFNPLKFTTLTFEQSELDDISFNEIIDDKLFNSTTIDFISE